MVALNLKEIDIDTIPLRFGKHKGSTPAQLLENDPTYLCWLYETIEPKICSKDLYMLAEGACGDDEPYLCGAD